MDDIPKTFHTFKLKLKNEFSGGIYDTKYIYNSSNFNFAEKKNESGVKNNINLEILYTNLFEENKKLENDKKEEDKKEEDKKEENKTEEKKDESKKEEPKEEPKKEEEKKE